MRKKLAFILILAPIIFILGCEKKDANAQNTPPAVEVGIVKLKKQPTVLTQEMSGRVKALLTSEVRPQVGGVIKEQRFKEGSYVKKGDVLYKIDPSIYEATFNEAKALLQSAKADVVSIEQKYKRYEELLKIDGISKQEFDDSKANYYKALALVEQRTAQLENAKINLDRTDVKAPIDGYIGISSVTIGALVTANQANVLATIRYTDKVYVDLSQSSSQLLNLRSLLSEENIKKGSANVTITLIDGNRYNKNGTLQLQEISVDEGTGAVTLRAEFDNKEGVLLPGMYVRASVEGVIKEDAYMVPQQAVARDTKANPIITVAHDNGSIETKIVDVQRAIGNKWVVTNGIKESDKIIIEGLNKINFRSTVSIVDLTDKYIKEQRD